MATAIGFLTVRRHHEHGYFGGYLVVNALARPLEFYCTMPIRPSRAQTLLYGLTIDDFVCGEQIAKALIAKAKLQPQLILTDSTPVLAAALVSELAVVKLDAEFAPPSSAAGLSLPGITQLATASFASHGHQFTALQDRLGASQSAVVAVLNDLNDKFDLCEPFDRIVEALSEAHPQAKAA